MREKLGRFLKCCLRIALRIFYICPVKKNRIFCANFCTPKYACNPKYLTEYLLENYPGRFEFVWMADIPESICREKGIRTVKRDTLAFFYNILTAKVFISNAGMPTYIPFRKQQTTIATWHGGGAYKHVGLNLPDVTQTDRKTFASAAKATNLFLSSSKSFTDSVIRKAFIYDGEVLESGLPRNDILFSAHTDVVAAVRQQYAVPDGARIILYAPTYRGDFYHASNEGAEIQGLHIRDCIQATQERFGGEWCLFYRTHHAITAHMDSAGCIDVSDYPDMQELLCTVDILITDYSSSMWDFALTKKPGFLFATDVQKYKDERDFDTPMSEWPFVVTTNNAELVEAIRNFNESVHFLKVEKHLRDLGSFENGQACEVVGKRIYTECFD